MKRRRILLLGVAGLLCASALLAIAILLVGRFGETERRIMATTLLLAGYGVVSLPGVVLLDHGRRRTLAAAAIGLAGAAAALALVSVWGFSAADAVGKSVGTATILAAAAAQTAALVARRPERDPLVVRRLFAASCVTAILAAAVAVTLIWLQPSGTVYARLLGALVVLDLLLVALQPVLARARGPEREHRFVLVLDSGERIEATVAGGDTANAAARTIRAAEHGGDHLVRLEVTNGRVDHAAGVRGR